MKCEHDTVLEIYTNDTHTKVAHYRCIICQDVRKSAFGEHIIHDRYDDKKKIKDNVYNVEHEISIKIIPCGLNEDNKTVSAVDIVVLDNLGLSNGALYHVVKGSGSWELIKWMIKNRE
jgi:hypothetical protein